MLNELKDFENLGTPNYFYELFCRISKSDKRWTEDNIKSHFYNRIVDNYFIFDGCFSLAVAIGALYQDGKNVSLNPLLANSLVNVNYLSNKILEMILDTAKNDEMFLSIFCPENMSYDVIYKLIQIDNSAFLFRFANFRHLLISFGLIYPHPDKNIRKFIINSKFKRMFDTMIMPEIRKRRMGISELNRLLNQQQINGKNGELFVLKFENERLKGHTKVDLIQIISDYDVAAGYDILSYENSKSEEFDRFIEVKSYSGITSFHWSRNEIEVARIKRKQYFLYLVNRDLIGITEYKPIVIKNPYEKFIENSTNWDVSIDGYCITQKNSPRDWNY